MTDVISIVSSLQRLRIIVKMAETGFTELGAAGEIVTVAKTVPKSSGSLVLNYNLS